MLHIILYQPEIPPNTGNIIRLCANTGFSLHLIHPLGFKMDEKSLRRAGCDYHTAALVKEHSSIEECLKYLKNNKLNQVYAFTTKGSKNLYTANFKKNDALLFGPETRGLPDEILNSTKSSNKLRIPMQENSRSLNLSNSVAIAAFEAWRQIEFS
jgi:tRNA (cytidine/uridine-2'-O-)-methyltransferase